MTVSGWFRKEMLKYIIGPTARRIKFAKKIHYKDKAPVSIISRSKGQRRCVCQTRYWWSSRLSGGRPSWRGSPAKNSECDWSGPANCECWTLAICALCGAGTLRPSHSQSARMQRPPAFMSIAVSQGAKPPCAQGVRPRSQSLKSRLERAPAFRVSRSGPWIISPRGTCFSCMWTGVFTR